MEDRLIRNFGDYKKLLSYQKSDVIFRITYHFCTNYLQKGDRTVDQMIQAARSGKQNIVEGSAAAATSTKTEIKLLNVAKASLMELLEDYQDFLNTRGHAIWAKNSVEYNAMRRLGREHNDAQFFMEIVKTRPDYTIANMAIILIKQADYLLSKQILNREKDFLEQGGFQERMFKMRSNNRK